MRGFYATAATVPHAVERVAAVAGLAGAGFAGPVSLDTVTLSEDTSTTLPNPERGFFHYTETHWQADNTGHTPLTSSALTTARTSEGRTVVFRYYYLEKFRTVDTIDAAYLQAVEDDMAAARTAGSKLLIRFAYADSGMSVPYNSDAPPARVYSHIAQLAPVLSRNADVIFALEAGFIGTWGEWYYTDNFTDTPATPGTLSEQNWTDRLQIIWDLLDKLDRRIFILVRYAGIKHRQFGNPPSDPRAHRVGFHNDAFLASSDDWGTFTTFTSLNEADTKTYMEQSVRVPLPVGGESANPNSPRSDWAAALADMQTYRFTFLNPLYHPDVLTSWGSNIDIAKRRLGYRLVAASVKSQTTVARGATLRVEVPVTNDGFAAPVSARDVYFVLVNGTGGRMDAVTNVNATALGPGTWTLWADIPVSRALPAGTYSLALWLPDRDAGLADRPEYSIRLANTGVWDSTYGYNVLRTVTVT